MEDDLRVAGRIDLIMKLYEQLEKSTDKIDTEIIGLRNITIEMIDILKHSTPNDEIIKQIKETNKKIEPTLTEVSKIHDKCKAHGEDVKSINVFLSKLSMWVRTMIIVVLVTFSLLTISYYFTRSSIENMVKKEFNHSEVISNTQLNNTNQDYIDLKTQLEELKRIVKKNDKTFEK